ncbi:hypothetical protein [Spirosoma endbachense]|uniref:Uncharacterized protein n=1 Tax=Spirosoma endbachense TaxID=2666025 RepID=A0A6P1W1S5_9BACT|nr:hypothetical protein [Spirosoma endbachense]QHV98262.1 hypothetical protein GJR95_26115 [Spirosoma endbachense]
MKTQRIVEYDWFYLKPRILILLCILSFLEIHEYDDKWNLPIIIWGLMGVFAGAGVTKIISGLFVLCWLYLWVLILQKKMALNAKLITPFVVLYADALLAGYQQINYYASVGHINERALFYIIPFVAFLTCTILLIRVLKEELVSVSGQSQRN